MISAMAAVTLHDFFQDLKTVFVAAHESQPRDRQSSTGSGEQNWHFLGVTRKILANV
jgi:hypothetical protein